MIAERKTKLGEPLRFATDPEEHESLVGLVARATADHVLLDLNRVLRRAGISLDYPGYLSRLDNDVLARLAPVLGCSVEQILSRATKPLSPDAMSSAIPFGAGILGSNEVETKLRRISPLTLAAGSHHREAWLLRLLPYCPSSFELLRSACSKCGAPLRWRKSVGIGSCETCEEVVAPTPAPLLRDEFRRDYDLFARLLSNRPHVCDAALAELSEEVRTLDGRSLVSLVLKLGACMHLPGRCVSRKSFYALAPETLAAIVSVGTGMLREWPTSIQAWARHKAADLAGDRAGIMALRKRLQMLGHTFSVPAGQARLMRTALPDVFGNVQRSFAPPSETLLRSDAAAILGTLPTVMSLIDAGHLSAEELAPGPKRQLRLKRADVEELRSRLDGSMSLSALSCLTDLPDYALENLCDHEIFEREPSPAVRYLRHVSSATITSIERVRARIFGHAGADQPHDAVALATAARRVGARLKPWTAILLALHNGSLDCWIDRDASSHTPWLRSILVRPADFARFDDDLISGPCGTEYHPPEECSLTDARRILNLDATLSVDLRNVFAVEIAKRQQRGPKKAMSMQAVLDKARSEISMAEICARAGWNPRQGKWALRHFDDVRTACGWDRASIEEAGVIEELVEWNLRTHRRQPSRFEARKLASSWNGSR